MKRYDKTLVKPFEGKRGKKEKTNYKFNCQPPIIYSPVVKSEKDTFVITQEGDRLDLLANEFYQDSSMWWLIADANNLGKGDLIVPAGKQIRIPVLSTLLQDKFRKAYEEK